MSSATSAHSLWISPQDVESLQSLAQISKDSVIDVYENGTVSQPYSGTTWSSSVWRTCLRLTNTNQNRNDLYKIRYLMQRAFTSYLSGNHSIKEEIKKALQGVQHLKAHYASKEDAQGQLENIILFVKKNLKKIEKQLPESLVFFNSAQRNYELHQLEASYFHQEQGTQGAFEGVRYYRDRICQFLFLEDKFLSIQQKHFLRSIEHALEHSENPLKSFQFFNTKTAIAHEIRRNEGIEWASAMQKAEKEVSLSCAQTLLNALEETPSDYQKNIGIIIPMRFIWKKEEQTKGHIFILNLCKDSEGTFTAVKANTGTFSFKDHPNADLNIHWNCDVPISYSFPPIVELRSLSRDQALNFLIKALTKAHSHFDSAEQATKAYRCLFPYDKSKQISMPVSARRSQVVGNCGVKSLKELLIYFFQKSNHIELANSFFKYLDDRTSETALPFEEIQPIRQEVP
jgi:hypothetical protein